MKLTGRIVTWVAGALLIISLFLHLSFDSTVWGIAPREALLLTLVALAVIALSIISIFIDRPVLIAGQLGLAIYLFGETFTIGGGGGFSGLQVGFWLSTIASVGIVIGAVFSVASIWSGSGWRSTTGFGEGDARTARSPAFATNEAPRPAAPPPPGWYPDPSGQGSQRYWSGAAWTDQVRA